MFCIIHFISYLCSKEYDNTSFISTQPYNASHAYGHVQAKDLMLP